MKTMKWKKILLAVFTLILFGIISASAYEDKITHPKLTKKAISSSNLDGYLKQYMLSQFASGVTTTINGIPIIDLLVKGSTAEDACPFPYCRRSTHFHNPLRSWKQAGMDALLVSKTCTTYRQPGFSSMYSALTWATGYEDYNGTIVPRNEQDMGWDNARSYYYSALTSPTNDARETFFAKTFQAVGQVMHLLQDMAVPAHVRNDFVTSHLNQDGMNNPYEKYVYDNDQLIADLQLVVRPQFTNAITSDFWDTVGGDSIVPPQISNPTTHPQDKAGLAEYTNANYISEGTLFWNSSTIKYPMQSLTTEVTVSIPDELNPGQKKLRKYYKKTGDGDWESGFYLAVVPIWQLWNPEANPTSERVQSLDDLVHKDYADRLLPRAVGYSAALLDNFFRGTLEISAPSTHVYSITDGSVVPQRFTSIKAKVLNTTQSEAIGNGSLQAVARYKIVPNYASDLSTYPPDGATMTTAPYVYSVSSSTTVSSISSTVHAEYTFDFSSSPIPAGITDLTLQVVFKGTLGSEIDTAVAVGMKDLMEPTHLVFWNLTDMFSLKKSSLGAQYELYTLARLVSEITPTTDFMRFSSLDINNNGLLADEPFLQPRSSTFSISFSATSTTVHLSSVVTSTVPAGRYIRPIVLVDQKTPNYVRLSWKNDVDLGWTSETFPGVLNSSDQSGIWQTPTPSNSFRFRFAADGTTRVPFLQHYYAGVIGCEPVAIDEAGKPYCPYPEEMSIPAEREPYPATISFP